MTLLVRGMAEGGWTYRRESDDTDESFGARFQAGAQTQLPNRWRVRLSYTGRYATDPQENPDAGFASRADEDYKNDVTLSVGGAWGAAAAGNVTELVRDQTRRARSAGAVVSLFRRRVRLARRVGRRLSGSPGTVGAERGGGRGEGFRSSVRPTSVPSARGIIA